MVAHACACGATIVAADLDGWIVWLDNHPVDDGMFRIVGGVDIPHIAVQPDGAYRRHICPAVDESAQPQPSITANPAWLDSLHAANATSAEAAAHRNTTAARVVLDAGRPLTDRERSIAQLRLQHPDLNYRQLAAVAAVSYGSCSSALLRVRRYADRLANTGAPR